MFSFLLYFNYSKKQEDIKFCSQYLLLVQKYNEDNLLDLYMGGTCTSHMYHDYGEIDTDHISATYYDITPDTAVVKSEQADVLVVTFTHNGNSTKKYYPIYVETRNSACTQK